LTSVAFFYMLPSKKRGGGGVLSAKKKGGKGKKKGKTGFCSVHPGIRGKGTEKIGIEPTKGKEGGRNSSTFPMPSLEESRGGRGKGSNCRLYIHCGVAHREKKGEKIEAELHLWLGEKKKGRRREVACKSATPYNEEKLPSAKRKGGGNA